MQTNTKLHKAKKAKNDEFYTLYSDIEKEVIRYKELFKDKIIYCNCDDPIRSNFVKYFINNFNEFKLRRLIATGFTIGHRIRQLDLVDLMALNEEQVKDYENSLIGYNQDVKQSYCLDINNDNLSQKLLNAFKDNTNKLLSDETLLKTLKEENVIKELKGNGDFRSDECVELLKQSDIMVTNPPFSLFREYISLLYKHNKKFLVIGNQNAVNYDNIFKHIKNNEITIGSSYVKKFINSKLEIEDFGNTIIWFTNLEINEVKEPIKLYKKYYGEGDDAELNRIKLDYVNSHYPRYDNYNVIEVSSVNDIPSDYYGVMGVPINFIGKYTPEQFKILDTNNGIINGKTTYVRLFIRRV